MYKRSTDTHERRVNVSADINRHTLTGLEKYTVYLIKIAAFTATGDGKVSNNVMVSTDEDGKYCLHEVHMLFSSSFVPNPASVLSKFLFSYFYNLVRKGTW